jgi:hypothetical protein
MRGKGKRVLTAGEVRKLYQLYEGGVEAKVLAEHFGTTLANVTRIIRGQIWGEVTGGRNISRYDAMVRFRIAYISARWDQGCRSQAAIAAELGISRQAVNKFMIRHQLGHHATDTKAVA